MNLRTETNVAESSICFARGVGQKAGRSAERDESARALEMSASDKNEARIGTGHGGQHEQRQPSLFFCANCGEWETEFEPSQDGVISCIAAHFPADAIKAAIKIFGQTGLETVPLIFVLDERRNCRKPIKRENAPYFDEI